MDLESLPASCRHRFPIFERKVYVNSCSQGALSDAVRDAYAAYLRDWDEHGAPWEYWVERTDAARAAFARLINASPEEIAVTTSVSAGVASLASGLRFDGRDTVVLGPSEFPTIGQIWHAQEARGARVVHHLDAIDERTKLVSVTHVSYRTGALTDVAEVVRRARGVGAHVLLDAYQTVGSLPLDVRALDVDFLVAGTLKYLLGSAGLAFLYCRRELWKESAPTATGWFADADVFAMDADDYSPAPDARRFQSGTPPIPSIYAGIAGIELMEEIGIERTRAHVQGLNDLLVGGVLELGGEVVTPTERGALVCIRSTDAERLVRELADDDIVTSARDGNLRVSPHAYNTPGDVDAVLAALSRRRDALA